MKSTFLAEIIETKLERVKIAKSSPHAAGMRDRSIVARDAAEPHAFRSALLNRRRINIIAEIKRASPSKGIINDSIDVGNVAGRYEKGGACAISVLTEEEFFKGSIADLKAARESTSLPLLQKDFIVDEFQIFEAAEAGADAILLIVAALKREDLKNFLDIAEVELGLDAAVEVHDPEELRIANDLGCGLIGVNNRDLHSFEVSLDVSRELIAMRHESTVMISESGIKTRKEIDELAVLGFDGFLIGETLMRSNDAAVTLADWTSLPVAV